MGYGRGNLEPVHVCIQSEGVSEPIKDDLTLEELAAKHGIQQTMIGGWKKRASEGIAASFSDRQESSPVGGPAEVDRLHAKIGQLVVEQVVLAKGLSR